VYSLRSEIVVADYFELTGDNNFRMEGVFISVLNIEFVTKKKTCNFSAKNFIDVLNIIEL
jgi:hypothetical protein